MAGPDYGALGATFKIVRILQTVCMISVIGLAANFVSEIVSSNQTAPQVLIGTLSVVCRLFLEPVWPSGLMDHSQASIAILYCVITLILFFDNILPFLINTGMDSLLLIALIVVAVTVGQPLTYLNCQAIGTPDGSSSAYDFTAALGDSLGQNGATIDYNSWIGATKTNCLEMKSVWGLSISLW